MSNVKHLTFEERKEIERLLNQKKSYKEMAFMISRAGTTIREELKRCPQGFYNALEAQRHYEKGWEVRRKKFNVAFTDDEVALIKKKMSENATRSSIRRKLGCSYSKLERWFEENAVVYRGGEIPALYKIISNIEQQLDIILDILRSK